VIAPLIGTASAVFLAYLVSPGVIAYLRDVIFPVFFDTTFTKTTGIVEGNEVYGRSILVTIQSFFWFLALFCVAGSYEILRYIQSKRDVHTKEVMTNDTIQPLRATLFMASLVFLAGVSLSVRFLDYFVYFCFLYLAIVFDDLIRFFEIKGVLVRKAVFSGVTIAAIFLLVNISLGIYDTFSGVKSYLTTQAPAEWLNTNLKTGSIVFNVDWDAFPTLYYFTGDRFRYVTGLEPRFLYDLNPRLYWEWAHIGEGIYCEEQDCAEILEARTSALANRNQKNIWYQVQGERIANAIESDFKTDIVVMSVNRTDLLAVLDNSSRFQKELFDTENSAYAVYRILKKE
jgi:hypothetical protein